jgi:hypothetical protein
MAKKIRGDVVDDTCVLLDWSVHSLFEHVYVDELNQSEERAEMFLKAYLNEDLIPDCVMYWCMCQLVGSEE